MSRCFPFPPPGYERKVRIDDIDLLAKEKHKEKKHKKDKKDKETRDKKDKDRSKERKDQKEKHKDKKERDGANGSTRTSEEKRIEGKPESYNGQKHGPNSLHNVDIKDFKYVQELDRRCRNDDGATGSQAVQKIMATDQRPLLSNHSREKGRTKDKKEDDRTFNAQRNLVEGKCSSDAFVQNSPSIDQRRLEGSAKSIEKDGEKQIKGRDQKENTYYDSKGHKPKDREKEKKVKSKDKDRDKKKEKKEKMKEISKPYEHPKLKGSGKDSLDACSNKALDPLQMNSKNFAAGGNLGKLKELEINGFLHGEKEKVKEISKPFEQPKLKGSGKDSLDACSNKALDPLQMNSKNFGAGGSLGKRKELEMNGFLHGEKEKVKEISKTSNEQPKLKGSGKDSLDAGSNKALGPLQMNSKNFADGGNLGKRKELEMNGYLHGEKEKVKEISKPSNEQPKQKASGKDSLDACSNKALDFPQMNSKNSAAGVNLGKRKELEMNGYLHENGFLPHKLPRPVSSHPVMENGRKSEPCQTVLQFVSEGQGAASNCKAEIKELRINGLKGSEQPNGCSTRPSSSTVKVNENGEASAKPPHPDSKYLSEILSIPEMGDGSDFDDQEWLFSSDGLGSKKPKAGAPGVETPPQVWAEAMHIESVDVFALPYVIPY